MGSSLIFRMIFIIITILILLLKCTHILIADASLDAAEEYLKFHGLQIVRGGNEKNIDEMSGEDKIQEEETLFVQKFRVLLGLKILKRSPLSEHFSPSPSPSPSTEAEPPSPAPGPVLPMRVHRPLPLHHSNSTKKRHKTQSQHRDRARFTRILVAVTVSAGAAFVVCVLGLIWFISKFRKHRKECPSTNSVYRKSGRARGKSKYVSFKKPASKVSLNPGLDLLYLNTLRDLEQQTNYLKENAETAITLSNHSSPKCEFYEREGLNINQELTTKPESDNDSSSSTREIMSVHEDLDVVKYESDGADKNVIIECHSSDDESFHSFVDSHSSKIRLSNASAGSLSDLSEVSPSNALEASSSPSKHLDCPLENIPKSPNNFKEEKTLPCYLRSEKFPPPLPPPPPPPPPAPAQSMRVPILHTSPRSIRIKSKSSSSSEFPNLSSPRKTGSSPTSKQTPQNSFPSSPQKSPKPLRAPLSIPPSRPPPPPPPPPPPASAQSMRIPMLHTSARSIKIKSKSSSSSEFPNLSSTRKTGSARTSNQTPQNSFPSSPQKSPKPLRVSLSIPPPPCPPPFLKGKTSSSKGPPPAPPSQLLHYAQLGKDGTPLPKLKPLHWDKVRAAPDRSMVWDHIRSSSFELDEEMIESLFGYNLQTTMKNDEAKSKTPSPSKHVLEPKRLQNITILSKALNATAEHICDALIRGNGLCLQQLEALVKMVPTKEEEAKIVGYEGDINELGAAERFVKLVLSIPFAFSRAEGMLYRENFEDEVVHLRNSFSMLEEACKELRSSRLFLKLLEAVLKTGNRMNVGTIRGGARAFKLDALLKLADVKGTDGKTTLLHFVVQEIIRSEGIRMSDSIMGKINHNSKAKTLEEKEEDYRRMGLDLVSGLSTELYNVKKTATIDMDVLASSVSNLSEGKAKLQNLVNKDLSVDEESGNFVHSMKTFLNYAEKNLTELQNDENRVLLHVREITEYFHGNVSKDECNPLRIFVIVRDFLTMLDHVCKELKSLKLPSSPNPLAPFR